MARKFCEVAGAGPLDHRYVVSAITANYVIHVVSIETHMAIVKVIFACYATRMGDGKTLLTFQVEPELLHAIDDYRYANRHPSRASAVKELLTAALHAPKEKPSKPPKVK